MALDLDKQRELMDSEEIFGGKDTFKDEDDHDYIKDIESIKSREKRLSRKDPKDIERQRDEYKESFRPKKDVEEHDNYKLPLTIKTKLDKIDLNLKQVHKENVALGYSIGILNETIEKIQDDLVQVATKVDKISKNPLTLYNDDKDDDLKTYEPNIDEDYIISNVLAKLKENSPKIANKKKLFFSFTKKELFIGLILLFLFFTNSYVSSFIGNFFTFFNKEVATEYRVQKGDKAICYDKNGKQGTFSLKEGEKIKINDKGSIKEFLIETKEFTYKCQLLN